MGILGKLYRMIQVEVVDAIFSEEEQELIKSLKKDGKEEEARKLISVIIRKATDPWGKYDNT